MKEQLAERLLARVMGWDAEQVAEQRPVLQALAAYKYDEYQRFSPGQRFIESLALWLSDFESSEHKAAAFEFVRKRLVFLSAAEIQHLVSIAYPDYIRPRLLRRAAEELSIDPYHVGKVINTPTFRAHQRSSLFLGLSDGARTDVFRRFNEGNVGHEQILQNYEIKAERVPKLLEKLRRDLLEIDPQAEHTESATFKTIVLMDDFSASGTSYLRVKNDQLDGKLFEFSRDIKDRSSAVAQLVDHDTRVLLVLYIATKQALDYLNDLLKKHWADHGIVFEILVVHPLPPEINVGLGDPLEPLLDHYYDQEALEDEHTDKGLHGVKFGYAACGLPVVLTHNTPNNSIYPLWASSPKLRPLFPRISRHKRS